MGVTLDPTSRIAGFRLTLFKNALKAFIRTRDPYALWNLKSVFSTRREAAIVFEECLDRGLISVDAKGFDVTDAGTVFIRAKAAKRTPLSNARTIVDELLARTDEFNARDDGIQFVERMWLYGSVLRKSETVGDIDIAIETSRRPRFEHSMEATEAHIKAVLARVGHSWNGYPMIWYFEEWITERGIFGPRRHPLLAGVRFGVSELCDMGVPCQLIYDRSRGGRVDDTVVPRHPKSAGRSNEMNAPDSLPDLTVSPLRPMDARWVTECERFSGILPFSFWYRHGEDVDDLFPRRGMELDAFVDGKRVHHKNWKTVLKKRSGLDGRKAVLLFNSSHWDGTSVVMRRQFEEADDGTVLRVWFEDPRFFRSRICYWYLLPSLISLCAIIVGADAERMARRALDGRANCRLSVVLHKLGRDDMDEQLVTSTGWLVAGHPLLKVPDDLPQPTIFVVPSEAVRS